MKKHKLNKISIVLLSSSFLATSGISYAASGGGFYGGDMGGSNAGFITKNTDPKYIYVVEIDKIMKYKPTPHAVTSPVNLGIREIKFANGTKKSAAHKGTDLGSPTGTPIKAISDGVISFNVQNSGGGGYGYYTGIDHKNGYKSLYAHLSKFAKKPGDKVSAGEVIGYTGNTGGSTGPHLHFELTYNSFIIDPFNKGGATTASYGDGLPRMDYSKAPDADGKSPQTNWPMPVLVPVTDFDCGTVEVANYMSQLNYKNPKGMTNIPTVIEAEPALLKTKEIEYGEAANECLTIFNDGSFGDMIEEGKEIFEDLKGLFSDPIGAATEVGKRAKERAEEMYGRMSDQYKKGICKRLKNGDLKGAAIDEISHAIGTNISSTGGNKSTYVSGIDFKGSSGINNIESLKQGGQITREDLVANHFTYLVIQNQIEKESKDVDKMLNVKKGGYIEKAIGDYGSGAGNAGSKIVEDKLDDIEDLIFGK